MFLQNGSIIPYLIADIPFELILVVTALVTVILLYKPIVVNMNRLMENLLQKEPINNLGKTFKNKNIEIKVREEEIRNEENINK